jgi:hypothetical protein
MKLCSSCKVEKSLSDFGARVASVDGLQYSCRACFAMFAARWRKKHPGKQSESYKKWRVKQPVERLRMYSSMHRLKNPEKVRKQVALQKKKHAAAINAGNLRRHLGKIHATPVWANHVYIKDMYMLAKLVSEATGIKHHVDHLVPLRSSRVCGLHVEHNLRVIPAVDNCRKQNSIWPDMAA